MDRVVFAVLKLFFCTNIGVVVFVVVVIAEVVGCWKCHCVRARVCVLNRFVLILISLIFERKISILSLRLFIFFHIYFSPSRRIFETHANVYQLRRCRISTSKWLSTMYTSQFIEFIEHFDMNSLSDDMNQCEININPYHLRWLLQKWLWFSSEKSRIIWNVNYTAAAVALQSFHYKFKFQF